MAGEAAVEVAVEAAVEVAVEAAVEEALECGASGSEEAGKTAGTRDEMIDEDKSEKMLSSSIFGQCL